MKFRSLAEIHAATENDSDNSDGLASLVAHNRGPGIAEHLFACAIRCRLRKTCGRAAGNALQIAHIRRKPNCCTLLHQNRLLSKYGTCRGFMEKALTAKELKPFQILINPAFRQAWNDVAEFQECFQIGKKESQAAVNLLTEVDEDITKQLITAVSILGYQHDDDMVCKQICSKLLKTESIKSPPIRLVFWRHPSQVKPSSIFGLLASSSSMTHWLLAVSIVATMVLLGHIQHGIGRCRIDPNWFDC